MAARFRWAIANVLEHGDDLAPRGLALQDVAQVVAHGGSSTRREQIPQQTSQPNRGFSARPWDHPGDRACSPQSDEQQARA
jgi:hypothetical protein